MSIFGRKIKSTPKRPENFSLVSLILSPDSVNFFKLNKDIWIWMPQCAILSDREKISCWLNLVQSTHIKAAASNSVEFVGPDTPQIYWKKNEDCYLQSFLRKQLQYKPSKNQYLFKYICNLDFEKKYSCSPWTTVLFQAGLFIPCLFIVRIRHIRKI